MRIAVFALALLGLASAVPGGLAAQATGPIKIGFISSLSGATAAAGKDLYSGCELYWQETGWQVAGRKLQVIVEDDEGSPSMALTKARRLVERDKVHVLIWGVLSSVADALVPYVEAQGIPAMSPIDSADDLTQRRRPRWLVRTGFSAGGNMHPFGEYAARTLGYQRIVTIGLDDVFGWETVGGFHRSFEDNGGQVVQKIWVPPSVQDYAPYVSQIRTDADAVFVNALGRWTLLFARAYSASVLQGKIPLIANGTYSDEHVLPQMGDESIGVVSAHHYSAALDTPANRRFRSAFEKAYSRMPSSYSESCYTGARLLGEAIKAVGGRVEDRPALMGALRTAEAGDAPRGPVRMGPYGNPTQNIYIRKVERVNGVLQNSIVFTYLSVSQFWKYNPEEFLIQPAYSREFPPCRHC